MKKPSPARLLLGCISDQCNSFEPEAGQGGTCPFATDAYAGGASSTLPSLALTFGTDGLSHFCTFRACAPSDPNRRRIASPLAVSQVTADSDSSADSMADMRAKAAAIEATAAKDTPAPSSSAGMSMGGATDSADMAMPANGADSPDAAPSKDAMKGMMGGMKGKMGKMKMSMDETKGMTGDKKIKDKMEGMKSMMSEMEGMMGNMESMMDGMSDGGGMKGMMKGGMDGMQMMGAMEDPSSMNSALPGFPGSSHLYHIGSTGFFLDHPDHVTLSPEQQKSLNEIAEASRLQQATTDRQIAEANQALFMLTGADEPDADKIDAKITEIENLAAERRRAFIRQVGEAAKVLSKEQRDVLVGLPMPSDSSQKPAIPSGGMSDS